MQSHRENDAHIRPTRPLETAVGYEKPEQPQTAVLEVILCVSFRENARVFWRF